MGWLAVFVTPAIVSGTAKMPPYRFAVWNLLDSLGSTVSVAASAYGIGRLAAGHHTWTACPRGPALGLAPVVQPWALIAGGAATVTAARLSGPGSYLVLALFCRLASASYLGIEGYAAFQSRHEPAFLARFRTWIKTRTDQLIIWRGLILGFWLMGKSIDLIVGWETASTASSPAQRTS